MEVYLIRHTSPSVAKGICYGQADIPLDEDLFDSEFATVKAQVPENIDHCYTSPLQRCARLASRLSSVSTPDSRLMELNFGDWELQSWSAIDPVTMNPWMADFVNQQVPKGESYLQLHHRTEQFIADLLATEHQSVAVVTHAGNIRSFISWVLDLPLENSFRIGLNYGAVVKVQIHQDKQRNQLLSIF